MYFASSSINTGSVQFNSHLFLSPIGARTLQMPVPYPPPNVEAYTRTPSHQPLLFGRKGIDHQGSVSSILISSDVDFFFCSTSSSAFVSQFFHPNHHVPSKEGSLLRVRGRGRRQDRKVGLMASLCWMSQPCGQSLGGLSAARCARTSPCCEYAATFTQKPETEREAHCAKAGG